MDNAIEALEKAGFTHSDDSKASLEKFAEDKDMHQGGPYVVHGLWKKDLVTVHIEQTTTTEDNQGLGMQVNHPPVAVINGPNGRVACNPDDVELLLKMVDEVG